MRDIPADQPGVGFNGPKGKAATCENPGIGVIHVLVADLGAGFIDVETIGVFHDELTPPHETKAGTDLVSEFGLDLVKIQRELAIGAHFSPEQIGDDFFMGRTQAKIAFVAILEP